MNELHRIKERLLCFSTTKQANQMCKNIETRKWRSKNLTKFSSNENNWNTRSIMPQLRNPLQNEGKLVESQRVQIKVKRIIPSLLFWQYFHSWPCLWERKQVGKHLLHDSLRVLIYCNLLGLFDKLKIPYQWVNNR
jgi:hypothetical protein